jgi:hypothetical protein
MNDWEDAEEEEETEGEAIYPVNFRSPSVAEGKVAEPTGCGPVH